MANLPLPRSAMAIQSVALHNFKIDHYPGVGWLD